MHALASLHDLLTTFSILASQVHCRGSASSAPHHPARVVEYHMPPVFRTTGQDQQDHGAAIHVSQLQTYEAKSPKASVMFSTPTVVSFVQSFGSQSADHAQPRSVWRFAANAGF